MHNAAFGISLFKKDLPKIIKYCNEHCPIAPKDFIYPVSWAIPARKLRKEYVKDVAENYMLWGNDIEQPIFAITDLNINATNIQAYGDNNNFIRFEYNGIVFIKKYCPRGDYETMTMKTRNTLGKSKKNLTLNIIGQFVLNSWEDKITPQAKILAYDVKENKEDIIDRVVNESVKEVKKNKDVNKTEKVKTQKSIEIDDDDFVF